jgi:HEPN domain-containing protein
MRRSAPISRLVPSVGCFAMVPPVKKTDFPFAVFSMEADKDYLLARMIHFLGPGFHARAGFFAHQASEKYMKAITVQNRGEYLETHNLKLLGDACAEFDPYFSEKETLRILEQFDLFDQVGRYGGAANFDPLSAGKHTGGISVTVAPGVKVAGLMIWTEKHLDDLDSFVFKTRSLLDHEKGKFNDGLKSILTRNRNDMLVRTWSGKQPLRVILTKKNRYFSR